MDSATLSGYLETIEDQGYCIVEDAVDQDLMRKIRNAVSRLEDENDVQPRGCLLYTSDAADDMQ